eukprot:12513561-Alexandrium_andersonii.AAC.1
MSASLVGSEMCIRDSVSARRLSSRRPSASFRSVGLPRAATRTQRSCTGCLLYTSDAADDM